jgi:TolB protein
MRIAAQAVLRAVGAVLCFGACAGELAGHKLLVTSVRTGDTEIYVANPDTGDLFNVSRAPKSEERYPCWSPDGKRIAFISDRNQSTNLYVMDANGGGVGQLTHTTAVCYMPSWRRTAEGERIVFGLHGAKPEMGSIRPDGMDLRVLGEGHDPCLSPDGRSIAYTGHVPGGVTVFLMNADGSNRRILVNEANPFGAVFPNWSPDSRQIVFSKNVGEGLELFVVNADGTGLRQLTKFGGGKVCTPSDWSPDGQWISFRFTDERYWSNKERMTRVYAEKPAEKRPVWIIRPDGGGARVVECLRYQMSIDGSRAAWKPLKTFPASGALPADFPAVEKDIQSFEDGLFVIPEPRRTAEQLQAIVAQMPGGIFWAPPHRWQNLAATRQKLADGGACHLVMLGDSIVNDMARSAWLIPLRAKYPKSDLKMTTVVRGGTGCWWYREAGRIGKYIAPLKPDLVILGGISQRGDFAAIGEVIRQVRQATAADVLLVSGAFGELDPRREDALASAPYSGLGEYGRKLRALAGEVQCGFLEMTGPWAEYLRQSGESVDFFKRDPVHANEAGEQILGRVLLAFFSEPADRR